MTVTSFTTAIPVDQARQGSVVPISELPLLESAESPDWWRIKAGSYVLKIDSLNVNVRRHLSGQHHPCIPMMVLECAGHTAPDLLLTCTSVNRDSDIEHITNCD